MSDNQTVQDEGRPHKYFTMMLNMADDDLDPFEYRLLGHYVRRCGEDGLCYESIRETARITQMGINKVQKVRDTLMDKGYVKVVKPTLAEARRGATVKVTIIDRWAENIARYKKPAVSDEIQPDHEGVSNPIQPVSNPIQDNAGAVSNPIRKKKENQFKERGAPKAAKQPTGQDYSKHDACITAWSENAGRWLPLGYSMDECRRIASDLIDTYTPEQIAGCTKDQCLKFRKVDYLFRYLKDDLPGFVARQKQLEKQAEKEQAEQEQSEAWRKFYRTEILGRPA